MRPSAVADPPRMPEILIRSASRQKIHQTPKNEHAPRCRRSHEASMLSPARFCTTKTRSGLRAGSLSKLDRVPFPHSLPGRKVLVLSIAEGLALGLWGRLMLRREFIIWLAALRFCRLQLAHSWRYRSL